MEECKVLQAQIGKMKAQWAAQPKYHKNKTYKRPQKEENNHITQKTPSKKRKTVVESDSDSSEEEFNNAKVFDFSK